MNLNENSIDAVDLCLLNALQTDARQPNHRLAERCGVSPATALRRVRRLEA
ncbi:Lrp/AsnC family transcriptional regulator, partial [Aquabacterium sp. A08]|uniref:Lrp/AsnC family transcriptional regulator n=1 Tax=Aquabacterium sp. A08 TaxID=2718532 RepID=UPI0035302F6E